MSDEDLEYYKKLNEEIFREEMAHALECSLYTKGNCHACDGCNIMEACSKAHNDC